MPRSTPDSSPKSSQRASPPPGEATTPDGAITPPCVPSTARRHSASHKHEEMTSSSSLIPLFSARGTPSQLPSPPRCTRRGSAQDVMDVSAALLPRRQTRRSPSVKDALHQRLRSTVEIAEAEAVRTALEFSMEMYRKLHQRKFASLHEELDFLRRDFVTSRRTLALMHEDNVRLERELLSRVHQVEDLQNKLEEAYQEIDERTPKPALSSHSFPPPSLGSTRYTNIGYSSRCESADRRRGDLCDAPVLWAEILSDEGGHKAITHNPLDRTTAGEDITGCENEERKENGVSSTNLSNNRKAAFSSQTPPTQNSRTPLALYAHTTTTGKKTPKRVGGEESGMDLHELIRDLRANLARRDTALNELQLEMTALQHNEQRLRTELTDVQTQLLQAKQLRDKAQTEMTSLEEQKAAQERELEECRAEIQQLGKDKDDLQRRLTTAELLYEHTGPRGAESTAVLEVDLDAVQRRNVAVALASSSSDRYLRDQLQLYRAKWQAAEDEVEHLNQRLSQLQRQLVSQGGVDTSAITPSPVNPTSQGNNNSNLESLAQQRAEHALELETLRRQHSEQLHLHAEEIQRLQRRLERAQENAAFHEDQLRQQRQDDTRQHHSELQALQTQLRTAQGELVKAQQDREHLARQLRHSTEQETTVEVLRGQVEQLKQRLGEVGAELAQVRGREKEVNVNIQRERLARAKAEHDAENAQEALARERKETQYLQEEIQLLREQLGVQEASAISRGRSNASPTVSNKENVSCVEEIKKISSSATSDGGDAASLASELKGYVSLMRVNTTLQRRIEELKAQVRSLKASLNVAQREVPIATPLPPFFPSAPTTVPAVDNPSVDARSPTTVEVEQKEEIHRLKNELEEALRKQRELLSTCAETEKDRRVLAEDNVTLAKGIEVLGKQLRKMQVAKSAEREHSRHHESALLCHLSKQSLPHEKNSAKHKRAKRRQTNSRRPPPHGLTSPTEESRVRQRLRTARAQDQITLQGELSMDPPSSASPISSVKQYPPTCLGSSHPNSCRCCCSCCNCCFRFPVSSPPQQIHGVCQHHDAGAPPPSTPSQLPPCSCKTESIPSMGPAATVAPSVPPSSVAIPVSHPPPKAQPSASLALPASTEAHGTEKEAVSVPPSSPPPSRDVTISASVAAAPPPPAHSRRDAPLSPLQSPRRHIHGSVLPPVFYPPLVLKSRA